MSGRPGRWSIVSPNRQAGCGQAPRLAEDLKSQQETMPKASGLSHRMQQGAGQAPCRTGRGWGRSEVRRLGREGSAALYSLCKFLLHLREAGPLGDGLPENAPLRPKTPLLEESAEVQESGTSLLQVGNEGQRCQLVDGTIVPRPTDKGGSGQERFSSFVLGQAGRARRGVQPFRLG